MVEQIITVQSTPIFQLVQFGINPNFIQTFLESGLQTIEQVAFSDFNLLLNILEKFEISQDVICQILQAAYNLLPPSLQKKINRNNDIYSYKYKDLQLKTYCSTIDILTQGGFATQQLIEISGESGTGKSTLCHLLAVTAQIPIQLGGLESKAIYIDTENKFKADKIRAIASQMNLDSEAVIRNILVIRPRNKIEQIQVVNSLPICLKKNRIGFIVLDSVIFFFRAENRSNNYQEAQERNLQLSMHLNKFREICKQFNVLGILTNQVRIDQLESKNFNEMKAVQKQDTEQGLVSLADKIVDTVCDCRIRLEICKSQGLQEISLRTCSLVKSNQLKIDSCKFRITDSGIADP